MSDLPRAPAGGSGRRALFVILMLGLTALFVTLGVWQLQRLEEKQALIAAVADRMDDAPVPLPPAEEWASFDPELHDYRPVTVSGRYLPESTVLVFTSLSDPRGARGGPGYWVMTPLVLEDGGTVFVNRGFVPQDSADSFRDGAPAGVLALAGIARRPEKPSPFTPEPDLGEVIDWIRNPQRLATVAGVEGPVAPVFIDLPAGDSGALPQGGETTLEFPNNHLGYALTWFGFALLTPVMLVFWLRRPAHRG